MKHLILAAVGNESLHGSWISKNKEYDLFLVYYGNIKDKFKNECDFYTQRKGIKFQMFYHIIKEQRDFFSQYDAIFMPDDDVYIEPSQIISLFEIFHKYELEIAQPSILGWYSWNLTLHSPFYALRYVNAIEIMCPVFSKNALDICLETFNENNTAWGLHRIWDMKLGYPKDKMAIIDDVIAIHTREVMAGDVYKNHEVNPWDEDKEIMSKYDLKEEKLVYWKNSIWKDTEGLPPNKRFYPFHPMVSRNVDALRRRIKVM